MTLSSVPRRLWLWAPPVAYLGLIFYLSNRPQPTWAGPYPDYLLHAAEYCVLAVLIARALNQGLLRRLTEGRLALSWALCVLYAASDEVHQYFVPGRSADYRDVLSDAAGAALGLVGLQVLQRIIRIGSVGAGDHPAPAVLYSRAGCAPCFAMKRAASRAARRRGVPLVIVDVDSDPNLQRLHGDQVPVLELPGGQLIHGSLGGAELDQVFLETARSAHPRRSGAVAGSLGGLTRAVERIKRLLGALA